DGWPYDKGEKKELGEGGKRNRAIKNCCKINESRPASLDLEGCSNPWRSARQEGEIQIVITRLVTTLGCRAPLTKASLLIPQGAWPEYTLRIQG
ncbi:hypothetical protein J6590_104882, partial [Homalodisca vitripennis]